MKKRAFIIHGWDGYPDEAWFPWLKKELEQKGFAVTVPVMPNPSEPKIEIWVPFLTKLVGEPDENTYLVGHSMGCQTILRYLASLNKKQIGGAVLVAGFFELVPLKGDDKRILQPWIDTPIDYEKITQATKNITAIFSDNDEWVPMQKNVELFQQRLNNPTIITEHNKGHYSQKSGVKELPAALEAIQAYVKERG